MTLPLHLAFVPSQVIVKLRDGATLSSGPDKAASANRAALVTTLSRIGARQSVRVFSDALTLQRADEPRAAVSDLARIYQIKLDEGVDVQAAVDALSADPNVEYAEPNYIAQRATAVLPPNDPLYSSQWGLSAINAETAWQVVTGTTSVVIAIVDSGIDTTHPDLASRLWINPGEIAGNGIDDDNDGLVDDVNGWSIVDTSNDMVDTNGHGTEVAGVAGAAANNGAGVAGVCWNCRLMTVKVMQPTGIANYSDIAAGIAYAAAKGAQVINLSLGGYADSATLRAAIQAASESAVIVGGAGNDGVSAPFYPAAYPSVIAVAATTVTNTKAAFSNYGTWVDVAAPGVAITTTFQGGDWGATNGTSLSAPFVAGLAGLLRSLHPDWSPALVRSHIVQTARSLAASDPTYGAQLGAGLIDASRAVQPPQPLLSVTGDAVNGTTSGRPAPNTPNNKLVISLRNDWLTATGISGALSTTDPSVTVVQGNASFEDIATGATGNGSAFTFNVAAGAGYNRDIAFSLDLTANGGVYHVTLPFTLTIRGPEESVPNLIIANTLWTSDKVYIVSSDVAVNAGVTLTLQPGTGVKFNGNYALTVNGTLIADGTFDHPIQFKSNIPGATWNRIHFNDSSPDAQADSDGNYVSGSILRHVVLESSKGGIGCNLATPYLAHITSALSGINCAPGATPLWLLDNTLSGGMYVTLGTVYAQRNVLSGGGLVATGAAVVLTNTVTGASLSIGTGLLAGNTVNGGSLGLGSNSTALNNTIVGGGISAGNTVTVTGNTVTGGGIWVGSMSVVMSNTVQNAPGAGITSGPNVVAHHNRLIGNGQGMVATTGQIVQNLFAYSSGPALQASGTTIAATSILSNSFTGNWGHSILLGGTSAIVTKIEGNNLEGNIGSYDLVVDIPWSSGVYVPANRNWWGTTDSNAVAARIYDFNDDGARAKVTYVNWLPAPAQDAPAYVRSATISPDTVLGIQRGTFSVLFSRPMDAVVNPPLTFYTARRGSWQQYTSSNSALPSNSVNAVAVDWNGSLWFGTPNGAARLMNSTWTAYNTSNSSLPSNVVNAIAADTDGSQWFGTTGGAARLSGGVWTVYTATTSALPDTHILAITVDQDRAKWFGTPGGAAWFDGATWVTYTVGNSGLPSNHVNAIAIDADRSRWFGTDGGIAYFDGLGWTTFTTATSSLPSNHVRTIAVDGDGVKWIGTDAGLARFDGATWTVYTATANLPGNDVRSISVDANGVKWIATGGGLAGFDGAKWISYTVASSGLSDNDVRAVASDYLSVKWLGLNTGGVGVLYDSPDYAIRDNAEWVAPSQFRATFDVSALIPRGVYSFAVGSALGLDGLVSAPHQGYTFTVDYASFVADTTPPPPPSVGAFGDGSLSTVSISWNASDPDSSITDYRYAIGTTPGGRQVVNWTYVTSMSSHQSGMSSSSGALINRSGLSLNPGQAYYVAVQARNAGGLWSQSAASSAVIAGVASPKVYLPLVIR